jgi:23S rRNA-/tRNA-specific pseudouridylate synthase
MFLHARSMTFHHPVTEARVTVESPLPEELARYLATLGE